MDEREKSDLEYVAYSVREREGKDPAWNRIGAAFRHKDGQGYDVVLNSLPVDGRVTLREQRKEEFKEQRSEDTRSPRTRQRRR